MDRSVLVLGCGYVGLATARLFHRAGWQVTGVTRSGASANEGFPILSCDITDANAVARLPRTEAIVDCVSSSKGGAEVYEQVYFHGAKNLLEKLAPKNFLFTSSTSVYAQTDHSTVDEQSAALPDRETGRILLKTEALVLEHGGIVARLAGIYGPGRSVLLRKFLDGSALIEGNGERIINQIHRDDAAAAIWMMITTPVATGIYNVSDDTSILQRDCYAWLSQHFNKPMPPSGPIDPNRKRGWTSKRVSNAKLRACGWRCEFPSFYSAVSAGLEL